MITAGSEGSDVLRDHTVQLLCAYAKLPVLTVSRQIDREEPVERPKNRAPRQVRHRLGTEAIDQLCADYLAGMSTREVAQAHGISKQSVTQLFQLRGVTVRSRDGLTPEELALTKRLYTAGNSVGEVARLMARPASTIYHALRRAGAATRSQKEASHLRYGIE